MGESGSDCVTLERLLFVGSLEFENGGVGDKLASYRPYYYPAGSS